MSLRNWALLRLLDSNLLKEVRLAFVFGSSGGEAFVVTRENEVYAVGKNTIGCLGFEANPSQSHSLDHAEKISTLSKMDIKSFAAACNHQGSSSEVIRVAVLTQDGKVYDWSRIYIENTSLFSLNTVIISDKVKEVACGSSHFLALGETGKVYSWGFNEYGQLGVNTKNYGSGAGSIDNVVEVTGEIEGKFVVEIGCGSNFSLALIDDGTVFGWGCCRFGQLGFKNQKDTSYHSCSPSERVYHPVLVPLSSAIKVRRIACGPTHVLALNRNGELHGWGRNDLYQLGRTGGYGVFGVSSGDGHSITCAKPSKTILQHRVADIGASNLHELSVAEAETGEIIFWGQSGSGQRFIKPTSTNFESIDEAFAYLTQSMHKPLIIPESERMTVAESLKLELGNKETSDVIIQTGPNEEIYAHKTILKMRSTYFKTKLPQMLKNKYEIDKVETKISRAPVMRAYLQYVYTDKLQVDLDVAFELFKLTDHFRDDDFKVLCLRSIKRQMTPEKVAEIYAATRKLAGAESLNQFCLEFAVRHAVEVMESPGYKNWDLATLQTFMPAYVKSRGY